MWDNFDFNDTKKNHNLTLCNSQKKREKCAPVL